MLFAYGVSVPSIGFNGKSIQAWFEPASEPSEDNLQRNIRMIREANDQALEPLREEKLNLTQPKTTVHKTSDYSPAQVEAANLNKFIRLELGLAVEIKWKQSSAIVTTPKHVLYRLDPLDNRPFPIDELINREEQMARYVFSLRKRKDKVVARIQTGQPAYLQVSHPKPVTHEWANRQWRPKPMHILLGDYWEGKERKPEVLNLWGSDTELAHALFFGGSGYGKSRTLNTALLSLLESTPPEYLEVYIIDPKREKLFKQTKQEVLLYSLLEPLPHVKQWIHGKDMPAIKALLQQFLEWCTSDNGSVHRLLIFEELHSIVTDKEVRKLLDQILSLGRAANLRVWMVTQVPNRSTFPPEYVVNTHWKCAHYIETENSVAGYLEMRGFSNLIARNEFILAGGGRETVVTAYHMTDEVIAGAIDNLCRKWVGNKVGKAQPAMGKTVGNDWVQVGKTVGLVGKTVGKNLGKTVGNGGYTRVAPLPPPSFPIKTRELTDNEAVAVYELHKAGNSQNKILDHVFGGKGGPRGQYVREAIERGRKLAEGEAQAL